MTWNGRGEKITDQAPQHPNGGILTHGYDSVGNRILLHSWRGRQTMAFDAVNRITAMWDAESPTRLTTWQYDARDLMVFQHNWNGTRTTVAFDERGLFSGIRHSKNDGTFIDEAQYQRDEVGAPTKRIEGGDAVTTWAYDTASQLIAEWRRDGTISTFSYDPAGNRTLLQEQVGASVQLTTSVYDAASQLVTETTGDTVLTHTFDANGNRQSIETPEDGTTTCTWDARDRLLQVEPASGIYAVYTYRPDNLRATVDVDEGLLKQVWDLPGFTGFGDLFEELDSGDDFKRAYYRAQRLVTQQEAGQGYVFLQSDLGSTQRLVDDGEDTQLAVQYSAWGQQVGASVVRPRRSNVPRPAGQNCPAGRRSPARPHDPLNRPTGLFDPDGHLTTWTFDSRGLVTRQDNWNGTTATFTHDAQGRTIAILHSTSAGKAFAEAYYTWDEVGEPTKRVTDTGTTTWVYDLAQQLQAEWHEAGVIATWSYDGAGNRTQQQRLQGGVQTVTLYRYDNANQIVTFTAAGATTTFTFDATGNMLTEAAAGAGVTTYSWAPRNRLTLVTSPSGPVATYSYRFDGLRSTVDQGEGVVTQVWDIPGSTGYGVSAVHPSPSNSAANASRSTSQPLWSVQSKTARKWSRVLGEAVPMPTRSLVGST
jgi:YD repeat-containing protein